jgi:hypothetical protein
MRRELVIGLGVALVVLVAALIGVLNVNKGSRMVLEGSIQKVRTLPLEEATVLVIDFRLKNPSNFRYVLRTVVVHMDVDGQIAEAEPVAEVDARRLFEYYSASLGQKYNDTLKMKDVIASGETIDRMVMVRFEAPEAKIKGRAGLKLRFEEIDGQVTEIAESGGDR